MARKIKQYKVDANSSKYIYVAGSGSASSDAGEILYVGVQGVPGTNFGINNGKNTNIKIGYTGVYEVDFSTFTGNYIKDIYIPTRSSGTVLVDIQYNGTISEE